MRDASCITARAQWWWRTATDRSRSASCTTRRGPYALLLPVARRRDFEPSAGGAQTASSSGAREWTVAGTSATGEVWSLLLQKAAPVLRQRASGEWEGHAGVFFNREGAPLRSKGALTVVAKHVLAAAGLAGLSSRSCRAACIVAARDFGATNGEQDAMARVMGNSRVRCGPGARAQSACAQRRTSACPHHSTVLTC